MKSWYPTVQYSEHINKYLKLVENSFNVLDVNRRWTPYILTPHQKDWHSHDVAILHTNAKSRVVAKSRNTSFTVSTLISNLTAVPNYPNVVVPFVRLNVDRAIDLIDDCKELIKNMNYVEYKGVKWPFNKDDVYMGNAKSITFPNGVEFRAFPANSQAANVIRGLRIAGNAGILDESNFMRDFEDIYIALRDAAAGSDEGKKAFQMNIGTTLKGRTTPFNIWFDKIKKTNILDIYKWPVFNPYKFDPKKSILEQDLIPIVSWHNLEDLEQKRLEDINRFLEEYMAQVVDSDDQFYPHELIIQNVNADLINYKEPPHIGLFYIAIDVASQNDYFVITIFEKINNRFVQRYLFYDNKDVDLPTAQKRCEKIIKLWRPRKVRVDSNGIGFQLFQALKKQFGASVEAISHKKIKTTDNSQTIAMNEFIHTNQKAFLNYGDVELLSDELQIIHYSQWNYNYKAESTAEFGHGDIAIANGYAMLPDNIKILQTKGSLRTFERAQKDLSKLQHLKSPDVKW